MKPANAMSFLGLSGEIAEEKLKAASCRPIWKNGTRPSSTGVSGKRNLKPSGGASKWFASYSLSCVNKRMAA
jgi:hypothetical protein